jgi:PAS domain S-box-containing protein
MDFLSFRDTLEKGRILKLKKRNFRSLVENNEGIITVDEKLEVLFRSPSSQRVTGYTDEEFNTIAHEEYFSPRLFRLYTSKYKMR